MNLKISGESFFFFSPQFHDNNLRFLCILNRKLEHVILMRWHTDPGRRELCHFVTFLIPLPDANVFRALAVNCVLTAAMPQL